MPTLTIKGLPDPVTSLKAKLAPWGEMFVSGRANQFKETELLPDFFV